MGKVNNPDGASGGLPRKKDYRIGRGSPPVEHQWKPNQSGNEKGRKKGSKNRKTIVQRAERKNFIVKKAVGRPRKMTATEIGMHNLQQDILRGDNKAFLAYLEILERYSDRDETVASMRELLAEDQAILANLMTRMTRNSHKSDGA